MKEGTINKTGTIAFTRNILANGSGPVGPIPKNATAQGRVKFTTMLRPDLKERLENVAKVNGVSMADLIEFLIEEKLKSE